MLDPMTGDLFCRAHGARVARIDQGGRIVAGGRRPGAATAGAARAWLDSWLDCVILRSHRVGLTECELRDSRDVQRPGPA